MVSHSPVRLWGEAPDGRLVIVKWAQEDVETFYNLLNNNNYYLA